MGALSYFLKASLNFRPGHLGVALNLVTAPFGLQARAAGDAADGFLSAAFTASALCANFLKILTSITFRGVILLARTRQPGHRDPASRR
jgi:hypothetical protein